MPHVAGARIINVPAPYRPPVKPRTSLMNTTAVAGNDVSPLRQVTANRALSGFGSSDVLVRPRVFRAAPQIALFLVHDLGASLTTAGLFYLTNLTAPVAGYLIGSRSDRTGRRLGLFRICAVAGFLGWAGISLLDPGVAAICDQRHRARLRRRGGIPAVRRRSRRADPSTRVRWRWCRGSRQDGADRRLGHRPGCWRGPGCPTRPSLDADGDRGLHAGADRSARSDPRPAVSGAFRARPR